MLHRNGYQMLLANYQDIYFSKQCSPFLLLLASKTNCQSWGITVMELLRFVFLRAGMLETSNISIHVAFKQF